MEHGCHGAPEFDASVSLVLSFATFSDALGKHYVCFETAIEMGWISTNALSAGSPAGLGDSIGATYARRGRTSCSATDGQDGFGPARCGSVLPLIRSPVRNATSVLSPKSERARAESIAVGNDDGKLLTFRKILPSSIDNDLAAWIFRSSVRDA